MIAAHGGAQFDASGLQVLRFCREDEDVGFFGDFAVRCGALGIGRSFEKAGKGGVGGIMGDRRRRGRGGKLGEALGERPRHLSRTDEADSERGGIRLRHVDIHSQAPSPLAAKGDFALPCGRTSENLRPHRYFSSLAQTFNE